MGERGTRAKEIADRIRKIREANGIGVRRLTQLVRDHIVGLGLDPYAYGWQDQEASLGD